MAITIDKAGPAQRIETWDLGSARERYRRRHGVDEERARKAEREFRRFATLRVLEPEAVLAPSDFVDEFWHEFVLDTRSYREFCEAVFGKFWEHNPKISSQEALPLYRDTLTAYRRCFGEPDPDAWGPAAATCSCGCSDSASCNDG